MDAEHLGAGSLRLLAVDIRNGEIVLDEAFDRRLELAATAVSGEGSVVAHIQGGNTRIGLWITNLPWQATVEMTIPVVPEAPVAPSEIGLEAVGGDSPVVAAGVAWSAPEHPGPFVIIVALGRGADPVVNTIQGELVGIVAASE